MYPSEFQLSEKYQQLTTFGFSDQGLGLPQLDLARYPGWRKLMETIRFLPLAFRVISQRGIYPRYTFHMVDRKEQFIGISAGDVWYYAPFEEIESICNLAIECEDHRFYQHCGIDVASIIRSLVKNIKSLVLII